jgi:myosin heavy subunit
MDTININNNCNNLLYVDNVSIDKCIEIIKGRYENKKIYTLLGSVLLSVNPYTPLTPNDPTDISLRTPIEKVINNLHNKNQVIIISGESGSGKTESTKQIIKILEMLNDNKTNITTPTITKSILGVNKTLLQKIQASGVVLEYFGNACTIKNHNSSRFGKFIEVFYKDGIIAGMKTNTYLLEKVRVLTKEHKNKFHVFTRSNEEIVDTLTTVGFSAEQIEFIFMVVNKVREILELTFLDKERNLDILVKTKIEIQEEQIEKVYNENEFNELRDTLAMKLYEKLFNWLVEQMNLMYEVKEYDYKIGILDIFGFEDLEDNSLEQLCINYANEIIQGLLNKVLIHDKLELYKREGVPFTNAFNECLDFGGNKDKIKLIQNIFTNVDEECILPKGSDSALIYKMNKNYNNCGIYSTSKISTHNKFTIEHFAGKIEYNIDNFIKKNMDKVNTDILKYIGTIFSDNIKKTGVNRNKVKINSITNQFCTSLNEFLDTIKDSELHFIKCIKPNDSEKPLHFNCNMVKEQLVYNGIVQLITILKSGYSHTMPNNEFDKTYRLPLTLSPISNTSQNPLLEVVKGSTLTFYTEETHMKLCEVIAKIREECAIIISKACRRTVINRAYGSNIRAFITLSTHVTMNSLNRIYITNIYAYKIQQFIKYAIDKSKYNKVKATALLANRIKTVLIRNAYNHKKKGTIIIKNMLINSCNYKKYKQVVQKIRLLQIRFKMHYNKRIRACVKIQLLWIRYSRMKRSVMVQNDILQKRNTYLENKVIELELQIMKLNSSLLAPLVPLVKHDKGTICTYDDVETIYTNYVVGSGHGDYVKVDVDGVDVDMDRVDVDNRININNEIKIKKLEEDIKNIVDDRIKLLTVIDTITKENRTMYRHIQNSSKSWFSRIFN